MQHVTLKAVMLALVLGAGCAHAGGVNSKAIVAEHNKWRAKVGAGRLSYSPQLAASAQAWADNLKKTNHCRMRHSAPDGRYGENLFWAGALSWSDGRRELQRVPPELPVDSWAGERADYNYSRNSCAPGKMCGHYTQVVWKSSTTVGCGYAVCEDSKEQIWVCQYQPAGNVVGSRPY